MLDSPSAAETKQLRSSCGVSAEEGREGGDWRGRKEGEATGGRERERQRKPDTSRPSAAPGSLVPRRNLGWGRGLRIDHGRGFGVT